ncbi:MAG: hypothetical protein JW915_24435 [Chitinispirillaceae bacterium]|nr:hypothetical protein [Chitinispirillaceae bacterium]
MKLLEQKITNNELSEMANDMFGNLVKAVVDIQKNRCSGRRTSFRSGKFPSREWI